MSQLAKNSKPYEGDFNPMKLLHTLSTLSTRSTLSTIPAKAVRL